MEYALALFVFAPMAVTVGLLFRMADEERAAHREREATLKSWADMP